MHIPISKTILSKKDITEVTKCLKSGWLVQGPKVKELEIQWSNFTKAKFSRFFTPVILAETILSFLIINLFCFYIFFLLYYKIFVVSSLALF